MEVSLTEVLERLLFGNRIEDKFYMPQEINYEVTKPSLLITPDSPGRPDFLKPQKGSSIRFPNIYELETDEKRAQILHFFANHELLAIELMSLALLRFTDSPIAFKKAVVKAIRDEQKHLSLYCQRIEQLGLKLGDLPVNSYFWDSMKNMQTPMDYVIQMSLTFEQANLDFAYQYQQIFTEMQDLASADVMKVILKDEIGHVGIGVTWLNKWKTPEESDWQAYQRHLPFPLTPARGKGKIFYSFLRERTGLSKEFIEEMELYSFSKGRVPDILIYNPDCEMDIATVGEYHQNLFYKHMIHDLAYIMTYLSVPSDIIILPQLPSKIFLKQQQEIGVKLPQLIELDDMAQLTNRIGDRKVRGLKPWGWSPRIKQLENTLQAINIDASYRPKDVLPEFQSKLTSSQLLQKYAKDRNLLSDYTEWFSRSCKTMEEIEQAIIDLRKQFGNNIVLRSEYGLAGIGMLRHFEETLKTTTKNWCEQILKTETLLVESWLDRVADCSCLLDIRNGKIKRLGITRILNNFQGQYLGTMIGKPGSILPAEVVEILYEKHNGLNLLWDFAEYAAEDFAQRGYNGPLCIDAFFYRKNGKISLKPCSEINARFSMGRIALEVSQHVMVGKTSLYCLITEKDLANVDCNTFTQFSEKLTNLYPQEYNQKSHLWCNGFWPLSDPNQTEMMLALLFVGASLQECNDFYKIIKNKII